MPLPLMAGIAIGQSIMNTGMEAFQNSANRRFQERMYNRQRQDALSDWAMQNEYNSPSAQMQRLKAAGLNPNLVYGNGTSGIQAASSPRSSSPGSYNGKAPQLEALQAYMATKQLELETDKTKSAITVNDADRTLKAAQTAAQLAAAGFTITKQQREQLGLSLDQSLFNTNIEMKKSQLANTQAKTQFTISENERQAAMNEKNLQLAVERIALMRAQTAQSQEEKERIKQAIENMKKSGELLELDRQMKANGTWWSDDIKERAINDAVRGLFRNFTGGPKLDPQVGINAGKVVADLLKKRKRN